MIVITIGHSGYGNDDLLRVCHYGDPDWRDERELSSNGIEG